MLFTYKYVPEMKNKTVEQIFAEMYPEKGSSERRFSREKAEMMVELFVKGSNFKLTLFFLCL